MQRIEFSYSKELNCRNENQSIVTGKINCKDSWDNNLKLQDEQAVYNYHMNCTKRVSNSVDYHSVPLTDLKKM